MSRRTMQVLATALVLIALALLVSGLTTERPWIWGSGLVAVCLAMVLSLSTRWVRSESNSLVRNGERTQ